jgi:hypothetical protein
MTTVTRAQTRVTRAVVAWYLETHRGRPGDVGLPAMFMDPTSVGTFAISLSEFERGDGVALFRMLVACAMFQRLRDQQILRILREMPVTEAREIGDARSLLALVDASPCDQLKSTMLLRDDCNLAKDARGKGCCDAHPTLQCHLKRHTVAMKRYGHFGKVPTSIALSLREHGAATLADLYRDVVRTRRTRRERAIALDAALCSAWRVHQKIASMFLSLVCNPDLSANPPWTNIDWTYFVVIDSNVDLFLASIGYNGAKTYEARRDFLWALSRTIKLREFDPSLRDFNPRVVQQALYLFMSAANRRIAESDCMHRAPTVCGTCPGQLATRCPVSA